VDSQGTELPLQAFVELLMILTVALLFTAFGYYAISDTREYQTYLAKDMALTMNALVLPYEDVLLVYKGTEQNHLNDFFVEFIPSYISIYHSRSDEFDKKSAKSRSYIYLGPSDLSTQTVFFSKPESVYLSKYNNHLIASETYVKDSSEKGDKCRASVNSNLHIFYDFGALIDLSVYESFLTKTTNRYNYPDELYELFSRQKSAHEFISMDFTNKNSPFVLFGPEDSVFVCNLKNSLIKKYPSLKYIPTENIKIRAPKDELHSILLEVDSLF